MTTRWQHDPPDDLRERLRSWVDHVAAESSPLYGRLGHIAANDDRLLALIAEAPQHQPGILLFFAAVHETLTRDPEHELAAWYPTMSRSPVPEADPAPELLDFVDRHEARIRRLITTRRVQTNEVGRCALILPVLHVVAGETGLPLALIEVGASAGLNLRFDAYRYVYRRGNSELTMGGDDAAVQLDCELTGQTPLLPATFPKIVHRVGLDLEPVDVRSPEEAAWIRALIWPDQPERHRRLAHAIESASVDPPQLVKGDAIDDLPGLVAGAPQAAALCVIHTHVMNQMTEHQRATFEGVLRGISRERELFRISSEWLYTPTPVLDLTLYRDGKAEHVPLGTGGKHGEWLNWTRPTSVR